MVDTNTILRKMTDQDRDTSDGRIQVDLNRPKSKMTIQERFQLKINEAEKKATKGSLPFARHAARDDFKETLEKEKNVQLREKGHIDTITIPVINLDKYSDLKNFEIVSEDEVYDSDLSNKNPGLNVQVKKITYKYKGYGNIYKVMESGPDAVKRAVKSRAVLDKSISEDLK